MMPKPPMVTCVHCRSKNEDDGRKNCRNCHQSMSSIETLYTTSDLAKRYDCTARAVARMARLGRWPSQMVLGKYRFTTAMVQWIDTQHEQWPQNEPAPAPQQPKPQPVKQTRQRRTPQPPPVRAAIEGNNVRRLVAKEHPARIRRPA
jgi:hypothetical protein